MECKNMNIDGYDVQFINNTWCTRHAWGHETTLYIDGEKINASKCRYYNRTWECYQYQSIMKNCVYECIEENKKDFIKGYKYNHGIKRLCGEKRKDCMEEWEKAPYHNLLKSIYNNL